MWMQIHDISFSKPWTDLEEGVGGVFGLGQIKVEYLHSKITENMPRTLSLPSRKILNQHMITVLNFFFSCTIFYNFYFM